MGAELELALRRRKRGVAFRWDEQEVAEQEVVGEEVVAEEVEGEGLLFVVVQSSKDQVIKPFNNITQNFHFPQRSSFLSLVETYREV